MPVIKNLEIYEAYKDSDYFKEGSKPGQIKHRVRLCGWFMTSTVIYRGMDVVSVVIFIRLV